MTMVSLTWPSVHLLKLSPVGDTPPEVFGLRKVTHKPAIRPTYKRAYGGFPKRRKSYAETRAAYAVFDPSRVRMLCDTLKALAPTMGGDQQRILAGAEKRLRAALVSFSMP